MRKSMADIATDSFHNKRPSIIIVHPETNRILVSEALPSHEAVEVASSPTTAAVANDAGIVHDKYRSKKLTFDEESLKQLAAAQRIAAVGSAGVSVGAKRKGSASTVASAKSKASPPSTPFPHVKGKKMREAKKEIRDMLVYCLFLTVFSFATLSIADNQDAFFFTDGVRNQIIQQEFPVTDTQIYKSFETIGCVTEYYQWLEDVFYPSVYTTGNYDSDVLVTGADKLKYTGSVLNRQGIFAGTNFLLGAIRIGQVRQVDSACNIPAAFSGISSAIDSPCYSATDSGSYDTKSFGYPTPIWTYTKPDAKEPLIQSYITMDSVPAANFIVLLPVLENGTSIMDTLQQLKTNHFIDLATRAVVVDINIYNPSLETILVMRLLAEMPRSGGVITSSYTTTVKLPPYFEGYGVALTLDIVFILFVLYYIVLDIRKLRTIGMINYVTSPSHLLEAVNLLLFVVTFVLKSIVGPLSVPSGADLTSYFNCLAALMYIKTASDINALNSFITWMKIFRYIGFIPRFRILLDTLSNAASETTGFLFIFAIVLFAASQSFMLVFGANIEGYRNLSQSSYTLIRLILGDFDFDTLRRHNPLLGPVLFSTFAILVVFVMLNMFIAIIGDSFHETKVALADHKEGLLTLYSSVTDYIITDVIFKLPFIGNPLQKYVEKMEGIRVKTLQLLMSQHKSNLNILALDANNDGHISREEFRAVDRNGNGKVSITELKTLLKNHNMTEKKLDLLVDLIDKDDDNMVDFEEFDSAMQAIQNVRDVVENGDDYHSSHKWLKAYRLSRFSSVLVKPNRMAGLGSLREEVEEDEEDEEDEEEYVEEMDGVAYTTPKHRGKRLNRQMSRLVEVNSALSSKVDRMEELVRNMAEVSSRSLLARASPTPEDEVKSKLSALPDHERGDWSDVIPRPQPGHPKKLAPLGDKRHDVPGVKEEAALLHSAESAVTVHPSDA